MRDWIEAQEQKRAVELLAQDFEIGDLVQGMGNFGDIWYEILSISRYDGTSMPVRLSSVTFVKYSKYGDERWTDILRFGDIRKIAKQSEVSPQHNIISLRGKKTDPIQGVVVWPNETPKGYSNCPERHPDADTIKLRLSP
jgi:hypothetical protein